MTPARGDAAATTPGEGLPEPAGVPASLPSASRPPGFQLRPTAEVLVVAALIAAAILLRSRLFAVPLERDEGEYAYGAQLLLAGEPFFRGFYTMKLPGITLAYAALIALFGQTASGIHAGLAAINAGTGVVLYLLARRLWGCPGALTALGAFLVLSLSRSVQGYQANAEHFVLLPALAGILLLHMAFESGRRRTLFWSGICLGIAILMKQHGALFAAFSAVVLLAEGLRSRARRGALPGDLLAHGAGILLPLGAMIFAIAVHGDFGRFWYCCVEYARHYTSGRLSVAAGNRLLSRLRVLFDAATGLWVLAAAGLTLLLTDRRRRALFAVLLLVFSLLATVPGFWLRPHYFVLLLPAVALLCGAALAWAASGRTLAFGAIVVFATLGQALFAQREVLCSPDPTRISHLTYPAMPFAESLAVAEFVRANTAPRDTVAIVGSEPQILFYAGRRSATGYLYAYWLSERHPFVERMIDEMIGEVERSRPRIVIRENGFSGWGKHRATRRRIEAWAAAYTEHDFEQVGVLEWLENRPVFTWGDAAREHQPRGNDWLTIHRRR